ncbi:hypothetical protein B0H10DRAFT_2010231 [Mycena sp. CBHHK59/15]|nr:hypothetical protein B0H10DRAFT_2010231 [Mycena sp. CBHHK59/15]
MSNISAAQSEFDFWEFVSCSRCQLPFASDSGVATVPFWLTECGHVVCNTHLNIDQSCAQCGMAEIQLVPLQREMEAPMSEWFGSIPHALDAVAYAAKFQQETMAFQIRYYKIRQQQQRALIDRLKRDTAELKKVNDLLANENAQFRQHLGYQDGAGGETEPSNVPNSNGKRPMNGSDQYRPKTASSSRSIATPLGPNRLTLPPGQHPPNLSSARTEQEDPLELSHAYSHPSANAGATYQRPGSSRLAEQYSYIPPSTPQLHPQQLSHSQNAPRRVKQNPDQQSSQGRHTVMPAARFKPGSGPLVSSNKVNAPGRPSQSSTQNQNQQIHYDARQRNMGPPPTPQHVRQQVTQSALPPLSTRRSNTSLPATDRFLPPSQRFAPPVITDQQHFMPSAPNGAPQRFLADGTGAGSRGPLAPTPSSRAPSRASMPNMSGGGQRVPFVPRNQGGFG